MDVLLGEGNSSEGRTNNEKTSSGKSNAHENSVEKICNQLEKKRPHNSVEREKRIARGGKNQESEDGLQSDSKNEGAYRGVHVHLNGYFDRTHDRADGGN